MTTDNKSYDKSFKTFSFAGMALDPIHVGTGGARLGRRVLVSQFCRKI